MKVVKHFSSSEWCKNFEIVFQGEEGLLIILNKIQINLLYTTI